jgi:hypothetical protein
LCQQNQKTMYNKKSQIVASLIKDGGSAKFAQVLAEVEQKMLKTGNPLRNAVITKLVDYNMLLNANYQNMVNNALIREGKDANFVAKENWFTPVNDGFNGSVVAKKSDLTCEYLKFSCNNAKTLNYFVDGVEATPEQMEVIKQYKQKSNRPLNQGLTEDNEVIIRTIKMEGIKKIKCGENLIFG